MQPALIATLVAVGIIVLLVVIVGIYLWSTYNSLVTLKVRVDEAWSDITVQLKRRADLIPNIIESRQGLRGAREGVFQSVTEARAETAAGAEPGRGIRRREPHADGAEEHLRRGRGLPPAAGEPELPAAAVRAGRHRGQDPGSTPVLQRRGPRVQHEDRACSRTPSSPSASASPSATSSRSPSRRRHRRAAARAVLTSARRALAMYSAIARNKRNTGLHHPGLPADHRRAGLRCAACLNNPSIGSSSLVAAARLRAVPVLRGRPAGPLIERRACRSRSPTIRGSGASSRTSPSPWACLCRRSTSSSTPRPTPSPPGVTRSTPASRPPRACSTS